MKYNERHKKFLETERLRIQKISLQTEEQKKLVKRSARRMAKIIKFTTSKLFVCGLLIIAQLAVMLVGLIFLREYINLAAFLIVSRTVGIIFAVGIINSGTPNEYKLIWVLFVLAFAVLGTLSYLLFGRQNINKRRMKKAKENIGGVLKYYTQDESVLQKAERTDAFVFKTANYLRENGRFPLLTAHDWVYFDIGEEYFERLKTELKKAERFIFMEYFIISGGRVWEELFEILKERASAGVEIRIIYDDLGCLNTIPKDFGRLCVRAGIKLYCFNKVRPLLDAAQNNRTHRKITVIDGKTAFTGGLNLADEYVNLEYKYGHWKDTGAMIRGNAVRNFTLMFLLNWAAKFGAEDIAGYLPETTAAPDTFNPGTETFCVPFCDTPGSNRAICEELYIKMLYNAREYVYINTPYFIIGDRVRDALISAARSGMDVRITVPHIPDKKIIFGLTRAFYTPLLNSGVKVYEYEPGFIHAKSIVSDDKYCIIGSSNMDFRSFYLHYECDMFMYKGICADLRADYEKTCALSILIKPETLGRPPLPKRIWGAFLRLFAPLM